MPPTVMIPSTLPSPITSDLQAALTTALLATSGVQNIHQTLLSSCKSTGWLDKVRERALYLLRNNDCMTYDEVMEILVAEARGKTSSEEPGELDGRRIENRLNHDGNQKEVDIRIPGETIARGIQVVKEALDRVVKIEDSKKTRS